MIVDDTERALFDQLGAGSDDARIVYADWLEEHGHADRATLLRAEVELPEPERVQLAKRTPGAWRTVVARAPVARCGLTFGESCTKRWDAMSRTEHDDVRHCGSCDQPIYYVRSLDEAAFRGQRRECIAIDAALVVSTATAAYDEATQPPPGPPMPPEAPIWVGSIAVEPDLPPAALPTIAEAAPEPRGVLERIGGWFRRRR